MMVIVLFVMNDLLCMWWFRWLLLSMNCVVFISLECVWVLNGLNSCILMLGCEFSVLSMLSCLLMLMLFSSKCMCML